jgi:PPOX class probable F420-dependent enzyme
MTMPSSFPHLAGQQYMSLTTFRKNGTPVPTPVWFAEQGGRLYVTTDRHSGKVKRIRSNGRVTVAPCKFNGSLLGEAVEASAVVVADPVAAGLAQRALRDKYGFIYTFLTGVGRVRRSITRAPDDTVYLEILPV